MSITQCPKCDEKVTVPVGGHRDARVRCPLCQAEYSLSEALDKLPPALILLDALVVSDELSDEPELSSDELNLEPAAAVGEFAFDSGGEGSTATLTKPATIRATARPKRKPKSPLVEGLKIVVGGALGLVIAQLILFWIPIARLGKQQRDPADLAPKIARFAPFLVPENLRTKTQIGGDDAKGNGKALAKNGKSNSNGAAKAKSSADSGDKIEPLQLTVPDNQDDLLFPVDSGSKKKTDEPSLDIGFPDSPNKSSPAVEPKLNADPDTDPDATGKAKAKNPVAVPKNPPPDDFDPPKPDDTKPAPKETTPTTPLVLLDAPNYSAADVTAALEAYQAANEAWSQSDDQDRDAAKKLKSTFYQSLTRLAEVATFADRQDAEAVLQSQEAAAVARELIGQAKQMELIPKVAAGWLGKADRPNNGVALIGIVKESTAAATVVEIPAKEPRLITILPYAGRGPRAAVGSRVLVLGAIVADPSENLEGYEGDEPQIVLETLHVVLPDADDEPPAPADKPPTDEKPATEKPADEKPADEKPSDKDAPPATPAASADESPTPPPPE